MLKKLTPRTLALSLEYHLLKKENALLRPFVPARVQSMLRRHARARYLVWDARPYAEWMKHHLAKRSVRYAAELQPGLLSIATPVWDGTPLEFFRTLAASIARQNDSGAVEWLLLDNGCQKVELQRYLARLAHQYPWVTLHREAKNQGIVGGLRICLERAQGRYLCIADSDDQLYPDCLQIVQWWIRHSGYAPLLYSDEDKLIGSRPVQPYFKPDFDPVLLLNSAYIAHLGIIDRAKALALDAYTDRNAEGSPDWDCFVRFYAAGFEAVHIPEVIYSWRMHPDSTADDAASKPYITTSQQTVLQRFLNLKEHSGTHRVRNSPLLPESSNFWMERRHVQPWQTLLVSQQDDNLLDYPDLLHAPLPLSISLKELVRVLPPGCQMICLLELGLRPERRDCLWEAQGLLERFPDAGMVAGWVADRQGLVLEGPLTLGFDGAYGCPDRGRSAIDPGYFTQMRKQRSVSAIPSRFAVLRTSFLKEAFESGGFQDVPIGDLGPWLGQFALTRRERIIYSPFLHCNATADRTYPVDHTFHNSASDRRYYPINFGLTPDTAYRLIPE